MDIQEWNTFFVFIINRKLLADNRSPMPKVYVRLARDARDISTFKYTIVYATFHAFFLIHVLPYTRYIYTVYIRCLPFPTKFKEFSSMTVYNRHDNVLKRIHPWLFLDASPRFRIASPLRGILSNLSALPDHRWMRSVRSANDLVKRIRSSFPFPFGKTASNVF